MSDWKRQTWEVSLESLPVEMASAIQQHIQRYNLGPILVDALMWIKTDSERVKKGLFGRAETVTMGAVATPRWLIWAIDGTKTRMVVLSAQLIHVTVRDYSQTPFANLVPDSGVEVSGMFTDAGESASAFLGLGEGMAGQKFRETVIKAAADAKK